MGNGARRIPSWPGAKAPTKAEYICADQNVTLTFRLQKGGGPYITSCRPLARNPRLCLMQVMKVQRRQLVLLAAVFVSASLLGCHGQLISRDALACRYEYYSGNKPQGTVCWVLNSGGGYVLGDANEPLSQFPMSSHGTWELSSDDTGQKLIIGKTSLPVSRTSTSIRITVNDDLGMHCDLPVRP